MEEVVREIMKAGEKLSRIDKLKKVYVHSALEFQRVDELLKNNGKMHEKVCLLGSEHMTELNRYLERLKKIRSYYYETSERKLPEILRPPIVVVGKLIRVKREVKAPYEDAGRRILLHLTFADCKTKHLEEDGRRVIIVTDTLPRV